LSKRKLPYAQAPGSFYFVYLFAAFFKRFCRWGGFFAAERDYKRDLSDFSLTGAVADVKAQTERTFASRQESNNAEREFPKVVISPIFEAGVSLRAFIGILAQAFSDNLVGPCIQWFHVPSVDSRHILLLFLSKFR